MKQYDHCVKCGEQKINGDVECPECGAIYSKVEAIWTKKKEPPQYSNRITFQYSDAGGNRTERILNSASIFRHNDRVYIYGHCELREEQRTFRADRIVGDITDTKTGEIIATNKLFLIDPPDGWADDSTVGQNAQADSSDKQTKSFKQRYKEAAYRNMPVCTNCGAVASPKTYTKGNIIIEIFLWMMFLFPGLIYSVWRLTSRYKGCPRCGAANMIPQDSPMAQRLFKL